MLLGSSSWARLDRAAFSEHTMRLPLRPGSSPILFGVHVHIAGHACTPPRHARHSSNNVIHRYRSAQVRPLRALRHARREGAKGLQGGIVDTAARRKEAHRGRGQEGGRRVGGNPLSLCHHTVKSLIHNHVSSHTVKSFIHNYISLNHQVYLIQAHVDLTLVSHR